MRDVTAGAGTSAATTPAPADGIVLIPRFAPAPVIVLTGHAGHGQAPAAAEAGAWDLIAKPTDPDMLRVVVGRTLRNALLGFAAGDAAPEAARDAAPEGSAPGGPLDSAIAALETRMIADALAASGGNRSEASRRLGIPRVGLGKKLKRLGIDAARGEGG